MTSFYHKKSTESRKKADRYRIRGMDYETNKYKLTDNTETKESITK